jgi:hypothetical protein
MGDGGARCEQTGSGNERGDEETADLGSLANES